MTLKIGFIGRGTFYKEIHKHLKQQGVDSLLLNHRPSYACTRDIIVNYGLAGDKLEEWRFSAAGEGSIGNAITLNYHVFGNKLECCERVRAGGVPVPECKNRRDVYVNQQDWIVKPKISFGGRGIASYIGQAVTSSQYLQKRITNRRYELRVHAIKWLPIAEWLVSKRTHPDGEAQLTWNHHQGGSFSNIAMDESNTGVFKRAKEHAKKAIMTLGYDFSAVDFIVQNAPTGVRELPVWFIEANLAPGFTTDRTREFYFNAFLKLVSSNFYDRDRSVSLATSIPPPVPVQETLPICAPPRRLTIEQVLGLIRMLSTSTSLSREAVINYVNNMQ
jgi:hypothetical protein